MLFDPVPLVGLCTHHPAHERRRLPDALIDAPADAFLRDAYRELVTVGLSGHRQALYARQHSGESARVAVREHDTAVRGSPLFLDNAGVQPDVFGRS